MDYFCIAYLLIIIKVFNWFIYNLQDINCKFAKDSWKSKTLYNIMSLYTSANIFICHAWKTRVQRTSCNNNCVVTNCLTDFTFLFAFQVFCNKIMYVILWIHALPVCMQVWERKEKEAGFVAHESLIWLPFLTGGEWVVFGVKPTQKADAPCLD